MIYNISFVLEEIGFICIIESFLRGEENWDVIKPNLCTNACDKHNESEEDSFDFLSSPFLFSIDDAG